MTDESTAPTHEQIVDKLHEKGIRTDTAENFNEDLSGFVLRGDHNRDVEAAKKEVPESVKTLLEFLNSKGIDKNNPNDGLTKNYMPKEEHKRLVKEAEEKTPEKLKKLMRDRDIDPEKPDEGFSKLVSAKEVKKAKAKAAKAAKAEVAKELKELRKRPEPKDLAEVETKLKEANEKLAKAPKKSTPLWWIGGFIAAALLFVIMTGVAIYRGDRLDTATDLLDEWQNLANQL